MAVKHVVHAGNVGLRRDCYRESLTSASRV